LQSCQGAACSQHNQNVGSGGAASSPTSLFSGNVQFCGSSNCVQANRRKSGEGGVFREDLVFSIRKK